MGIHARDNHTRSQLMQGTISSFCAQEREGSFICLYCVRFACYHQALPLRGVQVVSGALTHCTLPQVEATESWYFPVVCVPTSEAAKLHGLWIRRFHTSRRFLFERRPDEVVPMVMKSSRTNLDTFAAVRISQVSAILDLLVNIPVP